MSIRSGELVIISEDKEQNRFGLFKSLTFWIAVLVLVAAVLAGVTVQIVIIQSYESDAVGSRTADIQNQCTILCNRLGSQEDASSFTSESTASELVQLSNIYSGRVMIIDQTYHIVQDTYDTDVGKTIVSEDVFRSFSGESTTSYSSGDRYIEVTAPIISSESEQVTGVLLMSVSTDSISNTVATLTQRGWAVVLAIVFVALLVGALLGRFMTRPFRKISASIGAVTEGYEEEYHPVNTYTETEEISESVDSMLKRMTALDESRQEFVSNVSHELKTPLTSMKVLADSLLAEENVPPELYREFMQDMSEEIERENKIINDLLALVKMDRTSNAMDISSVDINAMVERILKQLKPIAANRNIELVFESIRPVTAEVDETKLSLAVTNLVENAIKYNRDNGWVHVTLNAEAKNFYLEVSDSGMGIPQKDLDHIFERFYRVDKSHSNEISGNGLGLSIAQSAAVSHQGSIHVKSRVGEGTTFTMRIPLVYIP